MRANPSVLARGISVSLGAASLSLLGSHTVYPRLPTAKSSARITYVAKPSRQTKFGDRDIVFAARFERKTGLFYRAHGDYDTHGDPEDETLDTVSVHIYRVNPDGSRLTRITFGDMVCETPRWSPDGTKIVYVGSTPQSYRHIYIMNADGSGRRRLTSGESDDTEPAWSPDGASILYAHAVLGLETNPRDEGICVIASTTSAMPRILCDLEVNRDSPPKFEWSPDGRAVAVQTGDLYEKSPPILYLADIGTWRISRYLHILDFAWSPDSRSVYLRGSDNVDRIFHLSIHSMTTVSCPIVAPVWVNNGQLIGDMDMNRAPVGRSAEVRLVNASGARTLQRHLTPGPPLPDTERAEDYDYRNENIDGDYGRIWRLLSSRPGWAFVCAKHGMSDGPHYECFLVNIKTGVFHHIRDGRFFGLSPNGRAFLVADYAWVGPYKRGGARVGPLEVVDVQTGHALPLSPKLSVVNGADWRGGSR